MAGQGQVEWDRSEGGGGSTAATATAAATSGALYIYWRTLEEWANIIYDWVPPPLHPPQKKTKKKKKRYNYRRARMGG